MDISFSEVLTMKRFGEKLIARNYKKRIVAVLIAAAVLLAVTAVLVPVTLGTQIDELRTLEKTHESQSETAPGVTETGKEHKHDDKEHEIKAILRQLTPVAAGAKIAFAAVALLALLVGAFYWITVAEWLYKTAVVNGLNRALWPMLGLVFNVLVIPVLLIVLCDPKRMAKQA